MHKLKGHRNPSHNRYTRCATATAIHRSYRYRDIVGSVTHSLHFACFTPVTPVTLGYTRLHPVTPGYTGLWRPSPDTLRTHARKQCDANIVMETTSIQGGT